MIEKNGPDSVSNVGGKSLVEPANAVNTYLAVGSKSARARSALLHSYFLPR